LVHPSTGTTWPQSAIIGSGPSLTLSGYKFIKSKPSARAPADCNYTNVWSFFPPNCRTYGTEKWHPCAKPVQIMERLVEMCTPEGGSVCDPFTGSGSTGVACVQTGRSFTGMELDASYCEIARARIGQAEKDLQGRQLTLETA